MRVVLGIGCHASRLGRLLDLFYREMLCYSAVCAAVDSSWCVRLSVCLSVTSRYCIKTTRRIELGFGMQAFTTYHTLCYNGTLVSLKIRALRSVTLLQTLDFKNFATCRSRCQQHSSSSLSTVEFVDDTYTTIDESWLFITSRSTVTL